MTGDNHPGSEALNSIGLRSMQPGDADAVARIHREEIPTAFLSTLGQRFLKNLYLGLLEAETALTLVAEAGGTVVGFVCATAGLSSLYGQVIRCRWWRFILCLLPKLVRPSVIRRCWETMHYSKTEQEGPSSDAEILSIAVDRRYAGRGVGRWLVKAALDALATRGARTVKVLCLERLEGANAFYRRCGFRLARTIEIHGRPTHVYTIDCSASLT